MVGNNKQSYLAHIRSRLDAIGPDSQHSSVNAIPMWAESRLGQHWSRLAQIDYNVNAPLVLQVEQWQIITTHFQ